MLSEPDDTNPIWRVWLGLEQPVGAYKPHSRITVEPGWRLRTTDVAGSRPASKLPIRYFVRALNDQQEVEIPGVRKWTIVEDIDQDADTLVVELTNNHFDPDYGAAEWRNSNGDFGAPGWLTPDRGLLSNRWGYVPNEWAGMLTKNAMIRTWEGYGGQTKTLAQAVTDGNLVLTGLWLVDDTPIQTGQGFQLQARNMGKLLVDEPTLPPLIPDGDYPMTRSRFHQPILSPPIVVYGHLAPNPHQRVLRMERPKTSDGYWLSGTDGGAFSYGLAQFFGSLDTTGTTVTPAAYPNVGITAIGGSAGGAGYRMVTNAGAVYCFGDAPFHGSQPSPSGVVIAIENAGSLDGYWLFTDNGSVYSFGPGAAYFGGGPPLIAGHKIADAASTPSGLGYFMVDDAGHVYCYGDAPYLGGLTSAAHPIVAIAPTPDGAGYYLLGSDGGVFCFGDAPFYGSAAALTLNDPMSDMVVSVDGTGYWLAAEDGGVFTYVADDSTVQFYGSMPGGEDTESLPGDYLDLSDVVKDLVLYAGWHLFDNGASENVYGIVEQTGVYSPDQAGGVLDAVFFDRQSVMDVLKKFRDAVGFLCTVDKWGGFVWREANVWESGNFLMDHSHTLTVPVLDERVNLKSYDVNTPDKPVVSSILISAALPEDGVVGIPTTTFVPANAGDLRGIVKPAEYINALFLDSSDELTMAELIALQLYFKSRLGTAVTVGNPCLSKDDQVQIIERETAEQNTFYIRKHERSHDRKSGDYTSTFTVNVLSPPGVWAVVKPDNSPSGSIVTNRTV